MEASERPARRLEQSESGVEWSKASCAQCAPDLGDQLGELPFSPMSENLYAFTFEHEQHFRVEHRFLLSTLTLEVEDTATTRFVRSNERSNGPLSEKGIDSLRSEHHA